MGVNTILKATIDGVEKDLYPKTQANNVYVDEKTTLPVRLKDIQDEADTSIGDIKWEEKNRVATAPIQALVSGNVGANISVQAPSDYYVTVFNGLEVNVGYRVVGKTIADTTITGYWYLTDVNGKILRKNNVSTAAMEDYEYTIIPKIGEEKLYILSSEPINCYLLKKINLQRQIDVLEENISSAVDELKGDLAELSEVEKSKNIFDVPNQQKITPNGAMQINVSDNAFTFSKIKDTSAGSNIVLDGNFTVDEDGDYTLSSVFGSNTGRAFNIFIWNRDTSAVVSSTAYINSQVPVRVISLMRGVNYGYRIGINNASDFNTLFSSITLNIQIEKGNTATEWASPKNILHPKGILDIEKRTSDIENKLIHSGPLNNITSDVGYIVSFEKIACIGDSLTSGNLNYNGESSGEYVGDFTSYPSILKRLTGCTVYNLGKGGMCASNAESLQAAYHSWIAYADGYSRQYLGDNYVSNAYIIALGTNDIAYLGAFTGNVATDIDIADYNNNDTSTSVGGYATIIQRILEKQPKAKIFCVCIPNTRNTKATRTEANTKIKAIASLFPNNCYIIDLQTHGIQESDVGEWKGKYYNGGHLNALGYNLLCKMYMTYINWIIEHNLNDFRNIGFIGTGYDWN